jgi:hypothetical protein
MTANIRVKPNARKQGEKKVGEERGGEARLKFELFQWLQQFFFGGEWAD